MNRKNGANPSGAMTVSHGQIDVDISTTWHRPWVPQNASYSSLILSSFFFFFIYTHGAGSNFYLKTPLIYNDGVGQFWFEIIFYSAFLEWALAWQPRAKRANYTV